MTDRPNLKTKIVQQLDQHPFGVWRKRNCNCESAAVLGDGEAKLPAAAAAAATTAADPYPLVVCTDDSGVFNITLSSELHRLAEAFQMDRSELLQLETRALEHAFADEACKQQLRQVFADFAQQSAASAGADAAAAAAHAPAPHSLLPVGILTSADDDAYKASDRALLAAYKARGRAAEHVVWNAEAGTVRDWTRYSGLVLRSVWDYQTSTAQVSSFLDTLARIEAAGVMLANPLSTVRWNHNKTYLRELAEKGVPSIDSIFVDDLTKEYAGLRARMEQKGWKDGGVIKPLVSASGMHTYRFSLKDDVGPDSPLSLASVLATCLTTGVSQWLLQPFQSEFMSEGEWSFVFLEGEHSHTVLSVPAAAEANESAPPAWQDDDIPARSAEEAAAHRAQRAKEPTGFMVQACHGGSFRYIDASPELVAQARAILHATSYGRDSLYARVDCIRRAGGGAGTLLVSELELIEPELFGRGVPGFQDKLIDAIDRRVARHHAAQTKQQR